MAITLTPIDDIEAVAGGNSEHAALIAELNELPTKAATFVAEFTGDDLKKYKKALQTAANRFELSVRFGIDKPGPDVDEAGAPTSTIIQAKLVTKQAAAGRPIVGPTTTEPAGTSEGVSIQDLEDAATETVEKARK